MNRQLSLDATVSGLLPVGPLHPHIAGLAESFTGQGYSSYSTDVKIRLLRNLDRWCMKHRIGIDDLDETQIQKFLHFRRIRGHARNGDPSTLWSLLKYLREENLTPPAVETTDDALQQLQARFGQYLAEERGLKQATLDWYLFETKRFLSARFGKDRLLLGELSQRDIIRFVLRRARAISPSGAKRATTVLRGFLRFLYERGEIATNLAASVPRVANWSCAGLPKFLAPDAVERILQTCDEQSAEGRRDHSILILLARLGLRAGEVVQMTLDDIDWDRGELMVRGKGGRQDRLPIPKDVGRALAKYIRRARPRCSSRRVFIRLRAPHCGLAGPSTVDFVVRSALKRAGLSPAHKGAHMLRHSLATRMLGSGASLTEIGKILRHQSPSTTAIYAKVDLAALRSLTQPWPGGAA